MDWANRIGVRERFAAIGVQDIESGSVKTRSEWAARGYRPKRGEPSVSVATFKSRQRDKSWPGTWHQPLSIELFHASQVELAAEVPSSIKPKVP